MREYLIGSIDGKVLGYDEGIKLDSYYGKMIEIVFPNLDGIKFVLNVGNALILIHISFDGSNSDKLGSILV